MRVLFSEADEGLVALYRALLEGDGHTAVGAPTMESAARLAGPWDVVLVSGLPNSRRTLDGRDAAQLRTLGALALVAERVWMEERPASRPRRRRHRPQAVGAGRAPGRRPRRRGARMTASA